jgi:hypothetical protein
LIRKQEFLTFHEHPSLPSFFGRVRVANVLVFCVFLLSAIPCCDGRYDFRMKRCSVRLHLQLFVWMLMSYLRLFAHSGVQSILCCVFFCVFFLCHAYPILPVSLYSPLLSDLYWSVCTKPEEIAAIHICVRWCRICLCYNKLSYFLFLILILQ